MFIISPISPGKSHIGFLGVFLATPKQHNQGVAIPTEIDAIARTKVYAKFNHALFGCTAIAKIAKCETVDARLNTRSGISITNARKPFNEWYLPILSLICSDFNDGFH